MDIEFILKHLDEEHLAGNLDLQEIAEESGMDVVKALFKNHSGMRVYIPTLEKNQALLETIIKENPNMSVRELSMKTSKPRNTIWRIKREIKRKNSK
jgi:hypothetical protein